MTRTSMLVTSACLLAILSVLFSAAGAAPGEGQRHRVVFQVAIEGDEAWASVLRNAENARAALGPQRTDVAVVIHGKGLGMTIAADNRHAERMKALADAGDAFIACENTMKRKHVTREQLLPFVTTVDSGIAEIVRRQEQGWSYIKT